MKKKKVFILAYTRQNIGDDLFIYMLLKRYPDIQFYINIEKSEHSKVFENFKNITVNEETARKLTKENAKDYDGYIYIGGSIFMEGIGKNYIVTPELLEFMQECKKEHIPFHYVSSNFGPYDTQEYLNLTKEVLKNCTTIHFRDKYSYNIFSEIDTVHYAPDLIFSYLPERVERNEKAVGMSVIDLSNRTNLKRYKDTYLNMLANNIKQYIYKGKDITLFSFCEYEGDEKAIKELMEIMPLEINEKINVVKYNGELEKFLREYYKMEYMICSRFHSMVLSTIMNQQCKVLSYSNKIDNVNNDLSLFTDVMHLNKINEDTEITLSTFQRIDNNKIDKIRNTAINQFSGVDKTLKSNINVV